MDPLSITAACASLAINIGKTSSQVTTFVRSVRDARGDMDAISRELVSLKTALDMLADDTEKPGVKIPDSLDGILSNCSDVMRQLDMALEKYESERLATRVKWTWSGKEEMDKYRILIAAHKGSLNLAIDLTTLYAALFPCFIYQAQRANADNVLNSSITRDIKNDTAQLREDAIDIKNDTEQILEEIAKLQARLPQSGVGLMLQKYLDNMTSYAGTAYAGSTQESELDLDDVAEEDGIDLEVEPSEGLGPQVELVSDQGTGPMRVSRETNAQQGSSLVFPIDWANLPLDAARSQASTSTLVERETQSYQELPSQLTVRQWRNHFYSKNPGVGSATDMLDRAHQKAERSSQEDRGHQGHPQKNPSRSLEASSNTSITSNPHNEDKSDALSLRSSVKVESTPAFLPGAEDTSKQEIGKSPIIEQHVLFQKPSPPEGCVWGRNGVIKMQRSCLPSLSVKMQLLTSSGHFVNSPWWICTEDYSRILMRKGAFYPIHQAIISADMPWLDLLIRSGADVTTRQRIGVEEGELPRLKELKLPNLSPLSRAIVLSNIQAAEKLLNAGAPIEGLKLLFGNMDHHLTIDDVSIAELLIRKGAVVNEDSNFALHMAVRHPSMPLLERLLESGASVDHVLKSGASVDRYSYEEPCSYGTPLHLAVIYGNLAAAKVLMEYGANTNLKAACYAGYSNVSKAVTSASSSTVTMKQPTTTPLQRVSRDTASSTMASISAKDGALLIKKLLLLDQVAHLNGGLNEPLHQLTPTGLLVAVPDEAREFLGVSTKHLTNPIILSKTRRE
ncbi:hypothetical protein P154DRAFT_581172 [Amniculicola lignicola CBS 123094]|uniref:Azaphilone pigments biosynthesis cluster protein L N-terminal domain-containing protein n=1 Tax=Amniculicola lignicola CBS 123094 TaxID=1392246 RepID=A0A6A5W031_9PLEO|nr:hypothetical protein P154DRAFT_581172 [Amniculicola lignicola CBS 123094]